MTGGTRRGCGRTVRVSGWWRARQTGSAGGLDRVGGAAHGGRMDREMGRGEEDGDKVSDGEGEVVR